MKPERVKQLRAILEAAEIEFSENGEIDADPVGAAFKYKSPRDRELVAFVCAILAYGKVNHIKKSVANLLEPMGESPTFFLANTSMAKLRLTVRDWQHRFNTSDDALHLLLLLKSIYEREGSLENFICADVFVAHEASVKNILDTFVDRVGLRLKDLKLKPKKSFWFFFPKPSSGSACKRLNLYLRWMVGSGSFDLKLWSKVCESRLMMPLDVHLLNQARSLKLTRRKQADWKTVEEVTAKLRLLDEKKPTRFDFALCHLGINGRILSSLLALIFLFGCATVHEHETPPRQAPLVVKRSNFTKQDEDRFLRAVKDDDVNQVHFFISMGMDVNKNFVFGRNEKETALMASIEARSRNSLRLLLDSGAKPDVLDDPNDSELVAAILSRQDLVALELIDKGALVDKPLKVSGETPLMSAARAGFCGVVKQLLDRGAKSNTQNKEGYTALMYAAEYGHGECVEVLLASGAVTSTRNKAKKTAKNLASNKLSVDIRKKL